VVQLLACENEDAITPATEQGCGKGEKGDKRAAPEKCSRARARADANEDGGLTSDGAADMRGLKTRAREKTTRCGRAGAPAAPKRADSTRSCGTFPTGANSALHSGVNASTARRRQGFTAIVLHEFHKKQKYAMPGAVISFTVHRKLRRKTPPGGLHLRSRAPGGFGCTHRDVYTSWGLPSQCTRQDTVT
jgi:hypothetical protein